MPHGELVVATVGRATEFEVKYPAVPVRIDRLVARLGDDLGAVEPDGEAQEVRQIALDVRLEAVPSILLQAHRRARGLLADRQAADGHVDTGLVGAGVAAVPNADAKLR